MRHIIDGAAAYILATLLSQRAILLLSRRHEAAFTIIDIKHARQPSKMMLRKR